MNIYYQDEYGEEIFKVGNNTQASLLPQLGDTVTVEDEDWRVVSRTFHPEHDTIVVSVTQNQVKTKSVDDVGDRLSEMQRAIVATNKRQDEGEKKSRFLREQVSSLRSHIKRNQPKKDTNDSR